jgi:hypothetical protein
MGAELALAGLVTSLVGAGASITEAGKTRKAQQAQAERVSAQNAAQEAASRRKTLREERVRRAQITAEADILGITGSSSVIAAEGRSGGIASESIGQTAGNLSATNALSAGSQAIASSQARQQLFSSVSSIGSSVFSAAGGSEKIEGLFK